jgi:hypothetical protein
MSLSKFTAVILFSLFLIGYLSCKKTDAIQDKSTTPSDRFFAVNDHAPKEIKTIAEALKRQNDNHNFLLSVTKISGYPKWDEARIINPEGVKISGKGSAQSGGTIVYIPFARDSDNYVNSILAVKLNPEDTIYRMLHDNKYRLFGFDTADHRKWNARDIFHLFTSFDYSVFGHTRFRIKDGRIFGRDSSGFVAELITKSVKQAKSLLVQPITACEDYVVCGTCNTARTTVVPCCNPSTYSVCTTYWIDIGGGSGGDGGWTGTGDGTGGGGGGGWYDGGGDPCPGVVRLQKDAKVAPIDDCGSGWEPEPVPIEDEPYDPYAADNVIIDTSITNNFPCIKKIVDSLTQYSNINALAQVALSTIFGVNEKIHLKFTVNPSWGKNDDDGDTKPDSAYVAGSDFYATIRLNPWVLNNSTQEYIAATIIHEAVHAYIDFKSYQYLTGVIDSTAFKTLFPLYWPPKVLYRANNLYYYSLGNLPQHQAMAANLIAIMTDPLKALYPNPGIPVALRDSIYNGISWGGLQETNVYKARSDTFSIKAINTMARDTAVHAPFTLAGYSTPVYTYDAHNLNMQKGCH